jgi:hypothetical protein
MSAVSYIRESVMKRNSVVASLAASALAVGLQLAPTALAVPNNPTCPSTYKSDGVGYGWEPTNNIVNGIRAPIKNRTDGLLCTPASVGAFSATWIAIQDNNSANLVQIGFDHDFNSNGIHQYCRFWAIGLGIPHDYYCNGDPDDTFVYFRIEVYGPGGYCTVFRTAVVLTGTLTTAPRRTAHRAPSHLPML